MKVAGLTSDNDWTFGRGRASYKINGDAVRQNVSTRLKSFKNDWFLDVDANIDWLTLLSNRNTETMIKREIERVTLATEGIASIDSIDIDTDTSTRDATITMTVTDVFSDTYALEVAIDE